MSDATHEALTGVLDRLDLDLYAGEIVEYDDDRRMATLQGEDTPILLDRQGEVLDALQYLVNRMSAKMAGGRTPLLTLDAEGFRDRRRQQLEELGHRLADEVRRSGLSASAGRLTPYERRIVHLVIADEEGVSTLSDGEGSDRRLRVVPA